MKSRTKQGDAPHVLVVEDEVLIRMAFTDALTHAGYRVSEATNGREALEQMTKAPADLVISDVKMPEMDGFQLLRQIRKQTPDLPVIMITGFCSEYSEEDAFAAGADAFVAKPFKVAEIRETVGRLLSATKPRAKSRR